MERICLFISTDYPDDLLKSDLTARAKTLLEFQVLGRVTICSRSGAFLLERKTLIARSTSAPRSSYTIFTACHAEASRFRL